MFLNKIKKFKRSKIHLIFLLLFIGFFLFSISEVLALSPQKIILLKPVYFGPKENVSIVNEIENELAKRLENKGHEVIRMLSTAKEPDKEFLVKISNEKNAQFVIYGTANLIGDNLSLDFRLINLQDMELPPLIAYSFAPSSQVMFLTDEIEGKIDKGLRSKEIIAQIKIKGHKRVDMDAIMKEIKTKEGEPLDMKTLSSDIKSIFKMGYFDDVQVDIQKEPTGQALTFLLVERPALKSIKIKGAKKIKEEKVREVLDVKLYSVINDKKNQENVQKIEALYAEKGFAGTNVTYKYERVTEEASNLIFEIEEGEEVHIKSIEFSGNNAFSDKTLKGLMETSEKPSIWLPTYKNIMMFMKGDTSVLKSDAMERDLGRIAAYYQNHGYVNAKVGNPEIKREDKSFYINIPVEEGPVYTVGKVDITEDYFKDKEKLLNELQITKEKTYNQEQLRKDIMKLTDMYADQGFAYADINPLIQKDDENRKMNIALEVNTGPKVYFDRIDIAGNLRTRDKVIRRELKVAELEPFSATGLKKSKDRLKRLGYFEDINLTPSKGSEEDKMNLKVDVKEMPTRSFSVGAGYSSVDQLILMGEISQRNFMGRGQTLNFKGILGSQTNRFSFGFKEPYLYDSRVSMGIDVYNWEREYTDYTKASTGVAFEFGYPFWENLKLFAGVRIDNTELSDILEDASQIIKDSQDIKATRSLSLSGIYDTRNNFHLPTRGWNNTLSVEYAGGPFGGDSSFTKYYGVVSYYHPLIKEFVGHIRAGAGYITEGEDGKLPIYEKFFLGGIDSVRGYKYGNISPIDPNTDERIGGEYMAFSQIETIFPLIKDMGMHGVLFFDAGNVWEDKGGYQFSELKKSVGLGVRWISPMGPLRIEWGYNLDAQPDDETSNWEFRMGGSI